MDEHITPLMSSNVADTLRLKTPFSMLIAGPSQSGKSSLVAQIIQNCETLFDIAPSNLIICYSRHQSLYDELAKTSPIPTRLVLGLPENLKAPSRSLLIIDDLQTESKNVEHWFTKNSHHLNVNVIYLVQNLFLKSPSHRTASLNAHYIIVFKNPRDSSQIIHLAKQISPMNPKFITSAFAQSTEKAHGYLMLDLRQKTNELYRVRDSVLLSSHIYVDKKLGQSSDLTSQDAVSVE